MNRKPLLLLAGALVVLLAGLGFWQWQRPKAGPAAGSPTAGAAPVTPAAPDVAPAAPATATIFTASAHDNGFGEVVPVVLTEDKTQLAGYYQLPYIKEYYNEPEPNNDSAPAEGKSKAALPPLDLDQPLTGKSYLDLLLLRNSLYARNGYCFMNATVRTYFDKQKWYRPVWSEPTSDNAGHQTAPAPVLRVPLNRREAAFAQRVHAQELTLLAGRVAPQDGHPMLALNFVVNQREQPLTPALSAALTRHNFAFVPTGEEQLFYLYDQNEYSGTPNFITTDLVLQLLHKYLNGILNDVEEQRLGPVLTQALSQGRTQGQALASRCQLPAARDAADWAAAYYAITQGLLTGRPALVTGAYAGLVPRELARATATQAKGSVFLQDSLFQYEALKPRGLYTRTPAAQRYFRAVKYLNTAPVFLDSEAGLLRAAALAQALSASPAGTQGGAQGLARLTQVLDVLVGDEDNRSLTNLLAILRADFAGQTLDQLAEPATLARLRQRLLAAGQDRIRPKGVTAKAEVALERPTLLFTAGRYSFDAEILSRLTEVRAQPPKRPFPKGLDVFAAFGNKSAEDVLLHTYREAVGWPAFPDTLRAVRGQFAGYQQWDKNLYAKTMHLLLGLNAPSPDANPPYFARTPAWQRRNLSTALAGWAELKHDLLLYSEQPSAAEMGGGGGGPPPPNHLAYVEPNLPFWDRALALLQFQDKALRRLRVNTPHLDSLNKDLHTLVGKLRDAAAKEVRHQPLTTNEMNDLSQVGGEVERLTLRILKVTQFLPARERQVALVADVYAHNADVLEEAVGAADALFVVVEINGLPVLARGAAFSYYEFISPSRLTDEEWQARLARAAPPRPVWLRDLLVPVPALLKNSKADQNGSVSIGDGQ